MSGAPRFWTLFQPDAVNLLKKNSSGLPRWKAPVSFAASGSSFLSASFLYAENNTGRNTLARRDAAPVARCGFAAIPFISANFSPLRMLRTLRTVRARARGDERRGREIAR